jgi:hypothetical protein
MRTIVSLVAAITCLLVLAGPAFAADPTAGAVREYPIGTSLFYKFGSSAYPGWVSSAAQSALGPDWSQTPYNNTQLPTFTYSTGGSGTVYYSSAPTSPCGTGNTQWLQCASNGGSSGWRIYIRNLSGAPYSDWTWCNISFRGTCWDAERALVHEAEHITMGIGGHDRQGEANTVMGPISPWYAHEGWNTHHIQRCDEAAGQLLTGMKTSTGPVADCFGSIAGHGAVGLLASVTSTTPTVSVCLSQAATIAGSYGVAPSGGYQMMSGLRLGARTVWFDRKPHTSSAWTLNVTSTGTTSTGGWARSFTSGATSTITYDFRPHVSSEPGLDGATGPVLTVTWRSGC